MKCKYCGAEMCLDDKDAHIFMGGVILVDKYWICDCGASAFEKLFLGGSVKLEFYPPEDEYRCRFCVGFQDCPAFDTGVSYPCPYFKSGDIVS